MTTRHTRGLGVLAAVGLLSLLSALGVSGCGVPDSGQAIYVPSEAVPYSLLATAEPSMTPTSARPSQQPLDVYYVTGNRTLKRVTISRAVAGPKVQAARLLRALVYGPDGSARAAGLSSSLGPANVLTLVGIDGGTALVSWGGRADPASAQLTRAVGQVVLTLTSLNGIDRVQFLRNGTPVDVPLPDGELGQGPLNPWDYSLLLDQSETNTFPPEPAATSQSTALGAAAASQTAAGQTAPATTAPVGTTAPATAPASAPITTPESTG